MNRLKKLLPNSLLFILVLMGACCSHQHVEPPVDEYLNCKAGWRPKRPSERMEEFAHIASHNAMLCKFLLMRADAGSITSEDFRTFIFITQHAWQEMSDNLEMERQLAAEHCFGYK